MSLLTATPERPVVTQEDVQLARVSALGWCRLTQPGWRPWPHIREIDHHLQRALHDEGPRKILIELPPQHGKCVTRMGGVLCRSGIKLAMHVEVGDEVASMRDGMLVWNRVSAVYESRRQAVRVVTRTGRRLVMSEDHRMLTQDGYVCARDLVPKEHFLVRPHCELDGEETLTDDELKVLAYMLFEGGCTQGTPTFTTADIYLARDLRASAEALGLKLEMKKSKYQYSLLGGMDFLRKFGMAGKLAIHKRLPRGIVTASLRQKWIFIDIMMKTDGYFCRKAGNGGICLGSHGLIDDIQVLLDSVGITSVRRDKYIKNMGKEASTLEFYRPSVAKILAQCDLGHKREAAEAIVAAKKHREPRADSYPQSLFPSNFSSKFERHSGYKFRPGRNLSPSTFGTLCEVRPELRSHMMEDFKYDRIESIERFDHEIDMVDFTVENDHNFIVNGLVSHNSSYANIGWPGWVYGTNPDLKIAVASYNSKLASEFTVKSRDAFEEWGLAVFGRQLRKDYRAKDSWMVDGGRGSVRGVGVGGSLTGFEAHILIIDDPYKSYEDALSPTQKEKVWQWYTAVGSSRMHKHGIQVIIHTRWCIDDLIGRLKLMAIERPDEFAVVSFPAVATADEFLSDGSHFRAVGDALCPELHPMSQLDEIKATLSRFEWNALYQQNPTQPDGTYWPDEYFVDKWVPGLPQEPDLLVVGVDSSIGRDQANSDYVAAVAVATNGDGKFYVDCWMDRKNPTNACTEIAEWVRDKLPRHPDVVGTDMSGYQELYAERLHLALESAGIHVNVVGVDHEGVDKTKRIQRLDPVFASDMVRFKQTRYCAEMLNQLRFFPRRDVHDDGPDAMEMSFRMLSNIGAYL